MSLSDDRETERNGDETKRNETWFASYAHDNTPYVAANDIDGVIKSLEKDSDELFQWFTDNQMKASSDKSHFFVGGKDKGTIGVEKTETEKSK